MDRQEANELLARSILEFDLANLKLALENGADINYNPSVIYVEGRYGHRYAVATDDSVLARALDLLGCDMTDEFSTPKKIKAAEDRAFEVVQYCVEHGIRLNTFYQCGDESCYAIWCYVHCYSEKILSYLLENGLNVNMRVNGIYTVCDILCDYANYDCESEYECGPYEMKMLEVLRRHGGKYSREILSSEESE